MSRAGSLRHIMLDKQLASLGDAYINFVCSLALTNIKGAPQGTKVSDKVLAEALRQAHLREELGSRVARGNLANAAEALLAEAYRKELVRIEESVQVITQHSEDLTLGISELLRLAARRLQNP